MMVPTHVDMRSTINTQTEVRPQPDKSNEMAWLPGVGTLCQDLTLSAKHKVPVYQTRIGNHLQ